MNIAWPEQTSTDMCYSSIILLDPLLVQSSIRQSLNTNFILDYSPFVLLQVSTVIEKQKRGCLRVC